MQNAERSLAFTSGMAALTAVVRLFGVGDHILAGDDLYGGTSRLLTRVVPLAGVEVTNVDTSDLRCGFDSPPTLEYGSCCFFNHRSTLKRSNWPTLPAPLGFVSPFVSPSGAGALIHFDVHLYISTCSCIFCLAVMYFDLKSSSPCTRSMTGPGRAHEGALLFVLHAPDTSLRHVSKLH